MRVVRRRESEGIACLQNRAKVNLIVYRSLKTKGLLMDVEHLPPAENAFAAHQRVRVAIDRLHNTENVHAMSQQVCILQFWFLVIPCQIVARNSQMVALLRSAQTRNVAVHGM